jgi:hypothetical protein
MIAPVALRAPAFATVVDEGLPGGVNRLVLGRQDATGALRMRIDNLLRAVGPLLDDLLVGGDGLLLGIIYLPGQLLADGRRGRRLRMTPGRRRFPTAANHELLTGRCSTLAG